MEADVWEEVDREVAVEAKQTATPQRPANRVLQIRPRPHNDTGGVRGRKLPAPSDADVDSGCYKSDFHVGQTVLVWYWGLWWHAKIVNIPKTKNCLTIKYAWSGKHFYGVPPRLVCPYP